MSLIQTQETLAGTCIQVRQNLLVNYLKKKTIFIFPCKNNLQFLAPLMSFTLTEHSNQHGNFSTNIYKSWTHYVQLAFFLPANKHPTFYEDVSDIRYQRLQNLLCLPKVVYAEFETAIHNAVTTVWPGLEVKACRLHLGQSWWRKIQSWDSASSTERKEERKKVS